MPYDLDSLMRNLGPGVGAQWAGQNEALSQSKQNLDNVFRQGQIEELGASNALNAQLNPGKVKRQELENQGLELGLGGIEADTTIKRNKAKASSATLESDIAAENDKNEAAISKNKYEKAQRISDVFARSAPYLQNQPAPLRVGMLRKILEDSGADAKSEQMNMFMQMAEQAGPEALPGLVSQFGMKLAEQAQAMDPKLRQQAQESAANRASQEKIHAGNNAATIQAARIAAESRLAAKNAGTGPKSVLDGVASGKIGYEKAATYFTYKAMDEEDPELKAKYEEFARKFEQAELNKRNAGAAGKVDTGAATGLPTQTVEPALSAPAAAPATNTTAPKPPKIGELRRGYRFKGGNPASPSSWEKE